MEERIMHALKHISVTLPVLLMAACCIPALCSSDAAAENATAARTPETILSEAGSPPDAAAVLELFRNASEWDAKHVDVRYSSQDALIELGADSLEPVLQQYLSSTDVRRRITLNTIVQKIGPPAAVPLIPHTRAADAVTRSNAYALLGAVSVAAQQENPAAAGPFPEDADTSAAFLEGLRVESDETVLRTILSSAGRLRDPEWVDRIAPFLDHAAEPVRLQAVIGLGYIPHAAAAGALVRALDDDLGSVRQAAVFALSEPVLCELYFDDLIALAESTVPGHRRQLIVLDILKRYFRTKPGKSESPSDKYIDAAGRLVDRLSAESDENDILKRYLELLTRAAGA
jgi:hypothetical protein